MQEEERLDTPGFDNRKWHDIIPHFCIIERMNLIIISSKVVNHSEVEESNNIIRKKFRNRRHQDRYLF